MLVINPDLFSRAAVRTALEVMHSESRVASPTPPLRDSLGVLLTSFRGFVFDLTSTLDSKVDQNPAGVDYPVATNQHDSVLQLIRIAKKDAKFLSLHPHDQDNIRQRLLQNIDSTPNLMWLIFQDTLMQPANNVILQSATMRLILKLKKRKNPIQARVNSLEAGTYVEGVLARVNQLNYESPLPVAQTAEHQAFLLLTLKLLPKRAFTHVCKTLDFVVPKLLESFREKDLKEEQSTRLNDLVSDVWRDIKFKTP